MSPQLLELYVIRVLMKHVAEGDPGNSFYESAKNFAPQYMKPHVTYIDYRNDEKKFWLQIEFLNDSDAMRFKLQTDRETMYHVMRIIDRRGLYDKVE